MDNRQTTELNRHSNHITACKILRVQENTVTVPLPWGNTCLLYTSKSPEYQGKSSLRRLKYGLKAARRAPQFSKR